ncbi:MAG TPA: hypothetical protein VMS86_15515 [Thermoanaerobaculia bacterium]|nr:hypothetical protein [Thermoanaerobaculia bacterium]
MTLNKVINVALLALVIWFGYTQLLPWFRSLGDGGAGRRSFGAGQGEEAKCVEAARDAAAVFSAEMRRFSRPPIDREAWDRTYLRIENRIARADDLCSCSRPACANARSALATLRDLGGDFSSAARGSGSPPIHAASSLSRVYDNLDAAAQLSRGDE